MAAIAAWWICGCTLGRKFTCVAYVLASIYSRLCETLWNNFCLLHTVHGRSESSLKYKAEGTHLSFHPNLRLQQKWFSKYLLYCLSFMYIVMNRTPQSRTHVISGVSIDVFLSHPLRDDAVRLNLQVILLPRLGLDNVNTKKHVDQPSITPSTTSMSQLVPWEDGHLFNSFVMFQPLFLRTPFFLLFFSRLFSVLLLNFLFHLQLSRTIFLNMTFGVLCPNLTGQNVQI